MAELLENYAGGNISEVNSTESANSSYIDNVAEHVASGLNIYYTPALVILGTFGNLISVYVFYTSKLRVQSTSQYLSALAVSDTVFLCQLVPPWLNAVQWTELFTKHIFCQVFVYISYVTSCLSAWLVVAFTIERFVAVLYPLRRNMLCTVTRSRYIIMSLCGLSLILNLPVLRFAIPTSDDCNIDYEYLVPAARFNIVDTAISFTLPLAVIMVLNAWIMVGVYRLERQRQEMMRAEQQARPLRGQQVRPMRGQRVRPPRMVLCPRSQQRVTRMLLIVSSVFVVLNLPAYTMRILAYAYDMTKGEYSGRWAAIQQVALMFFNTNFGINFILYCLSGQNFRVALKKSLPWRQQNEEQGAAEARRESFHPGAASSVSMSYVTEVTSTAAVVPPVQARRERSPYISRWMFENIRQSQPMTVIDIEMEDLPRPCGILSRTTTYDTTKAFSCSNNVL